MQNNMQQSQHVSLLCWQGKISTSSGNFPSRRRPDILRSPAWFSSQIGSKVTKAGSDLLKKIHLGVWLCHFSTAPLNVHDANTQNTTKAGFFSFFFLPPFDRSNLMKRPNVYLLRSQNQRKSAGTALKNTKSGLFSWLFEQNNINKQLLLIYNVLTEHLKRGKKESTGWTMLWIRDETMILIVSIK